MNHLKLLKVILNHRLYYNEETNEYIFIMPSGKVYKYSDIKRSDVYKIFYGMIR